MSSILSSAIMQRISKQALERLLAVKPTTIVATVSWSTSSRCQSHHGHHDRWNQVQQKPASVVNMNDSKIGFIGCGKIAQSIIQAIIKKQLIRAENIHASEINKEYLVYLRESSDVFQKYKINFEENSIDLLKKVDTVLICVKPSDFFNLLKEISGKIERKHLVLSIAAAIKLGQIEKNLPNETRVIRAMPNINALIHQSCTVFARGKYATNQDAVWVQNLFRAIGTCENEINEDFMDVITALSGSGPAYMFLILDALADGGVKMGLTRDVALRLSAQTMLGSATMALNEINSGANGKHVMHLKEQVCSPGGTSIHGIYELEHHGVRSALIKCVESGTLRAREMNAKKKD